MPTKRKRIGFLPNTKIKEIIDQISEEENLSQSRVVGILVEEALELVLSTVSILFYGKTQGQIVSTNGLLIKIGNGLNPTVGLTPIVKKQSI